MQNEKTTRHQKPILAKPKSSKSQHSDLLIQDKEMRKKIRNRQSALAARERKKARLLMLKQTVRECEQKREKLIKENLWYRQKWELLQRKRIQLASSNPPPNQLENHNNGLRINSMPSVSGEIVFRNHSRPSDEPQSGSNSVERDLSGCAGFQHGCQAPNYDIRRNSSNVLMKSGSADHVSERPLSDRRASLPCYSSCSMANGGQSSPSNKFANEIISPGPIISSTNATLANFPYCGHSFAQPPLANQPIRSAEVHLYVPTEIQTTCTDDVLSTNVPANSNVEMQYRTLEAGTTYSSGGSSKIINIASDTAAHSEEHRRRSNFSSRSHADMIESCQKYRSDIEFFQQLDDESTSHLQPLGADTRRDDSECGDQRGVGRMQEYDSILQWLFDE